MSLMPEFLSFPWRMNSPIFSTPPICCTSSSMFSAASLAPPCAGPQRQATPAAMAADGVVPRGAHSPPGGGEGVRARGAAQPHRRGRRVLLVVGVEDEDAVERAHQHVVRHVLLARRR